jgi:hypothetical protein
MLTDKIGILTAFISPFGIIFQFTSFNCNRENSFSKIVVALEAVLVLVAELFFTCVEAELVIAPFIDLEISTPFIFFFIYKIKKYNY